MFDNLQERFQGVINKFGKNLVITEEELNKFLREVRIILLEADVNLNVIKAIIEHLKIDLINAQIYKTFKVKQVVMKALSNVLLHELEKNPAKEIKKNGYYALMGLQGVGKTTTCAKLAYKLKKTNKKVLAVSLDLHRYAAYEQLQQLCIANDIDFFEYDKGSNLQTILELVGKEKSKYDIIILDSAGRSAFDEELMEELQYIYKTTNPVESFLVIDTLSGQRGLKVVEEFNKNFHITGIIGAKADADVKGGFLLSATSIIDVPIRFLGMGEKINQLQDFNAQQLVNRILDQGDILSLIENFDEVQEQEQKSLEEDLLKGVFTLDTYKKQLNSISKMGGFSSLMGMIPGMSSMKNNVNMKEQTKNMKKFVAIINSMTKKEKRIPDILNYSRKKRIAKGSATTLQEINILLKQYNMAKKMFKSFGGKKKISKKDIASKLPFGEQDIKNLQKLLK